MSEINTGFILYDKISKDVSQLDNHLKKSLNLFVSYVDYAVEFKTLPLLEFNATGSAIANDTIPLALPLILKRNPSLRVLYISEDSSLVEEDQVNLEIVVASQKEAIQLLTQSSLEFDLVIVCLEYLSFSLYSKLKKMLETTSIRVK